MKNIIKEIFNTYELLRLGTIDKDGLPNVRSVDFAMDSDNESVLYFTTFNNTNKVNEIEMNNNVYIVVDKEASTIQDLAVIKYIRGKGNAYKLTEAKEIGRAMELLVSKYPFLPELPGEPSMMSVYKIQLSEVSLTDNAKGFGHVDTVKY